MSPPSVHPQQALAVYAETLAVRRRVVVFSDEDQVSDRLADLGARQVVTVRPGEHMDDLRPGSFDLALVPDLGIYPEPDRLLSAVRRLVGEAGVAMVAATNRDAAGPAAHRPFDYYELFDLVAREFGDVRMVAQLGFYGVALVELGTEDDAPAVSVDAQLVEEQRAPEAFVAVASQRGVELEPYAIVELPAPPAASELDATGFDVPEPEARAVEALHEEIIEPLRLELAEERLRVQIMARQMADLEAALARLPALERELVVRTRVAEELTAELEQLRTAAAGEQARAVGEASSAATLLAEELARRAERAERALARIEPELAHLHDTHAAEHTRFESALQEQSQAIRALEVEVARRERMVRDLVSALEEPTAAGPARPPQDTRVADAALEENTRLRERLDALALDLARRQAEAEATGWRIAELERQIAGARLSTEGPRPSSPSLPLPGSGPPAIQADARLAAALDELEALRKALRQEHEQRVRAEAALKPPPGPDLEPPRA